MKIQTIVILIVIAELLGCSKDIKNSIAPQLAKNHKSLNPSQDSIVQNVIFGNPTGMIRVTKHLSSSLFYGYGQTKSTYGVFGDINDNNSNDTYVFSIGKTCTRTPVFNNTKQQFIFSNTSEQLSDGNYSDLYGGTPSFSLSLNGNKLFSGTLAVPDTILMDTINRYSPRSNISVNWNKSVTSNNLGVIVLIYAYDGANSPPVGEVYDIFPDGSNTQNISYLFENFPNQNNFMVQVMRGNYYQTTLANGSTYTLIVYSASTNSIAFP